MLVPVKDRLHQPHIAELLEYTVFADDNEWEAVIRRYKTDDRWMLLGYTEEDEIIGIIGYEKAQDNTVLLRHLAVDPQFRGLGYGRGMILEMLEKERPVSVKAEVDEEAADFFRNIGFEIISLGEKFPGSERFECSFVTDFEQKA